MTKEIECKPVVQENEVTKADSHTALNSVDLLHGSTIAAGCGGASAAQLYW